MTDYSKESIDDIIVGLLYYCSIAVFLDCNETLRAPLQCKTVVIQGGCV